MSYSFTFDFNVRAMNNLGLCTNIILYYKCSFPELIFYVWVRIEIPVLYNGFIRYNKKIVLPGPLTFQYSRTCQKNGKRKRESASSC